MGDGTLPREAYKTYMIQDYLYLVCRITSTWPRLITDVCLDSIRSRKRFGELQIDVAGRHCSGMVLNLEVMFLLRPKEDTCSVLQMI